MHYVLWTLYPFSTCYHYHVPSLSPPQVIPRVGRISLSLETPTTWWEPTVCLCSSTTSEMCNSWPVTECETMRKGVIINTYTYTHTHHFSMGGPYTMKYLHPVLQRCLLCPWKMEGDWSCPCVLSFNSFRGLEENRKHTQRFNQWWNACPVPLSNSSHYTPSFNF